jgi:heat shock protein HslJ
MTETRFPITAPLAALVALAAAGCTPIAAAPEPAPQAEAPAPEAPAIRYRAVGTEPFWALTIEGGTMTLERPDREPVTRAQPVSMIGGAAEVYRTRGLAVIIYRDRACSDGMSDRTYPDTVRIIAERVRYQGCGGTPDADAADTSAIIDGSWQIESIAGRQISNEDAVIRFEQGRIAASVGCNRIGGSFRFESGRLSVGTMMSTKMACPGPLMEQESALARLLGQRLSVTTNPAEKLVMTAPGGETLVLRPLAPAPRPRR